MELLLRSTLLHHMGSLSLVTKLFPYEAVHYPALIVGEPFYSMTGLNAMHKHICSTVSVM